MAQLPKLQIPLPPRFLEHPGDPRVRWSHWMAQLNNFFTLTNLTLPTDSSLSDEAKNAYLATLLGCEGSRIFMAHPIATQASTLDYDTFAKEVGGLFERPNNTVRADYDFRSRKQGATETVTDYITALRTLHIDCERPEQESHNLAMQLALGCYNQRTQEKLLTETVVDLDRFVQIMQADETAQASSAVIRHDSTIFAAANPPRSKSEPSDQRRTRRRSPPRTIHKPCLGCGQNTHCHKDRKCPAFNKTCTFCKRLHHFSSVCLKKRNNASVKYVTINTLKTRPSDIEIQAILSDGSISVPITAMVDTGSAVSTVHECTARRFSPSNLHSTDTAIHNFDGSIIRHLHRVLRTDIIFNGKHVPADLYVVPDTCPSVMGRDVLGLLDITVQYATSTINTLIQPVNMSENMSTNTTVGLYPNYQHHILLAADAQPSGSIQAMLDSGVWSRLDKSEWQHVMVVVDKRDGGVRITSDLSSLNCFIVPDRHPLPHISDLFLRLRGARFFSKLDLTKAYYHIALDEESKRLTATITPLGLMRYNRLPMGMKDSAAVFQKLVSQSIKDCPNAIAYIDDILVYADTLEAHDLALRQAINALENHHFKLNKTKCIFGATSVDFLGHRLSAAGIEILPERVASLTQTPQPSSLKQLQAFLGAVNYLAQFLPHLASLVEPLRCRSRKNQDFIWIPEQTCAFNKVKAAIKSHLSLAIFDPSASTFVTVDASDTGLGAELSQIQNGQHVPVRFASHTLTPAERQGMG